MIFVTFHNENELPVYSNGEIERYNVFNVIMVIRHAKDGKMYLYDIMNIKKETRYPSWTRSSDGQKPVSFH